MASRRSYADEYAERVNRAVELLAEEMAPADAVRVLQAEQSLSERQARRYVNAAIERPDGVAVPERTVVFTVTGSRIAADSRLAMWFPFSRSTLTPSERQTRSSTPRCFVLTTRCS